MEILHFKDVNFTYAGKNEPVLKDISFSVQEGEMVLICGASGCGKSTLLRLIKPALNPFGEITGEIFYNGEPLHKLDFYRQSSEIGFVSQNPNNQVVTDKVWHEMAFGLENLGIPQNEMELRIGEMASYFGIENWFYNDVKNLSGGQKQLLNLASIMAIHPKILLLDEPTSMLDPIAAADFLATLKKLNREFGITILLIEHQLEDAFHMCDKVLVMDSGRLHLYDEPKSVATKLSGHIMEKALPTPTKAYLDYAKYNNGKIPSTQIDMENFKDHKGLVPTTIQEGRNFLKNCVQSFVQHANTKDATQIASETESSLDLLDLRKNKASLEYKNSGESQRILEAKNITFRYEINGRDILKGVKLHLNKGEILGILGGNGSGKSTLLSILAGVRKQLFGKLKIDSSVGLLPQNPLLMFSKDRLLDDLIEYGSMEKINQITTKLSIDHLLEYHPYDLSGGEQQRAAITKLLLLEPEIFLLDEPTKALDALTKYQFGEILEALKEAGKSIIIVSHDVDFASTYCDRCLLLFQGLTVGENNSTDFFKNNHFYTTATRRMSIGIFDDAVTYSQLKNHLKARGTIETKEV